jgi:hypothetical protein
VLRKLMLSGIIATLLLATPQAFAQDTTTASLATVLDGQTASGLEAMIGAPTLTREEQPALLWQHADELCVLQVFLYTPASGGDAVVKFAQARMREDGSPPLSVEQVPSCLQAKGLKTAVPDAAP